VGAIVSAIVVGFTIKYMDTPTSKLAAQGIQHAIGEEYAAPQATLMATLIKGIMGHNLDWNFVLVGVFIAIFMELCGIKALSFAVGSYLPLSTTLPIFIGGFIRGVVDKRYKGEKDEEEDLRKGNLFATGLVAGGALAGVLYAILKVPFEKGLESISLEHQVSNGLGAAGYQVFGVICFAAMGFTLYRVAMSKKKV
ncbi:MAG TPA: OPT/YSL family transporter, partial [Ferruginibacter sp.]|nr:OPT/YSL family transporter [Ferruginibacter sp.]